MAQQSKDRLISVIDRLAMLVATAVALILPLFFFNFSYRTQVFELDTLAQVKAGKINELVTGNPELWMHQVQRIEELLTNYPATIDDEVVSAYDAHGALLVRVGNPVEWPPQVRSRPLFDSGRAVGRIDVEHSLQKLIAGTVLAALLGLLLGGMGYGIFRAWPLRELQRMGARLKAEHAALRESEARFRTLFEWMPEAIGVHRDGRLTYVNPAMVRMLGASSAGDLIGTSILEWVHPDFHALVATRAVNFMNHGATAPMAEMKFFKLDRSVIDVEIQSTSIVENGILAVHSFLRDITERKQVADALRESEQRFRSVWESSTDGMRLCDASGRIAAANAAYCSMVGKTAEELVGKPFVDVYAADSVEGNRTLQEYIQKTAAGTVNEYYEKQLTLWNGEKRWLAVSNAFLKSQGGAIFVLSISRDVTEQKRSEAALLESEGRFRTLVDWTPEPFFVHRGGVILYVNPATIKLFGATTARDLIGTPVLDRVQEDFRQIVLARVKKITDDGGNAPLTEMKFLKLDATVIDVEVQGTTIAFEGAPAIHVALRDITERKHAEAEVRTLFRAMEQSPVLVLITNRAGKIGYVNPHFEKVTGYSRAEVIGNNPRILQSGNTAPEIYQQMWAAISVGGEWRGELCNRRKNGELFWEFSTISGVRGDDGEIEHYIAVMEDITERKQAEITRASLEAQLRESQKMQAIGTLAGGIAHDFNNALATILGNVELAREDMGANPRAQESLEEIQKAGTRVRGLVQQILSFSRRQPTERRRVTLAPIIEESVRMLRATLPARLALEVHLDDDVPPVMANAPQIQQVVINLATNAMQAMRDKPGRIDVRLDTVTLDTQQSEAKPALRALHARQIGRTVRLMVRDNGPGMDREILERIFEPFFTTKAVNEGTGLGLSVVHGIVQTHEGAIEVDSQSGKGSTFTLYLPAAEAEAATSMPANGTAVAAPVSVRGGQHILYLDDDESLVFLVQRLLERRGYRVSGYTDQREALAALGADPADIDLFVTDYNMPGMSGLDVARQVHSLRADLPVAIASGFIDETLQTQAESAGVRELIFKANAVEDLCEAFVRLAQSLGTESASC